MFYWNLNFIEIVQPIKTGYFLYLGNFKICKNAVVQFIKFSLTSDHFHTDITCGFVKIWHLDIHAYKVLAKNLNLFKIMLNAIKWSICGCFTIAFITLRYGYQ